MATDSALVEMALTLVRDLKRNDDIIPPYQGDRVKDCINGINSLYTITFNQVQQIRAGTSNPEDSQRITTESAARSKAIQFVYRCLIAYQNERLKRIKGLRWQFGGAIPHIIKANLNETELEFFNEYCTTLADFQSSFGDSGVNLLACTKPPKELYMQVRVLSDYGEFETSDGNMVTLTSSSIHNMLAHDCEMLIRKGVLEPM